jgi:hypothetical protein
MRADLGSSIFGCVSAAVILAASAGAARAQLVLPGAGSAASGVPALEAPPAPHLRAAPAGPAHPAPVRSFSEESLVGKTFYLNGSKGKLTLDRRDPKAPLRVQFIAAGDKLTRPGEACGVEFGNGQPVQASPIGRPDGVLRLKLDFEACPVTLDVLDSAVLVGGVGAACRFQEADCSVDPRGMWGPQGATLDGQAKEIETDRSIADKSVRQNFKALLSRTKDKQEIKAVASEQAGFTSERETVCRDYSRETLHGFCATRFTEWRAASLAARVNRMDGKPEEPLVAQKTRPKPRPPVDATASMATAPPGAPPPPASAPPPAPRREPNFFERLFR